MLKAVTFDFWNTLVVDRHWEARSERRTLILAAELERLGEPVAPVVLDDALAEGYDYFDRVWFNEQRTPTAAETLDAVLSSLGRDLPAEASARVLDEFELSVLDVPPELSPDAGEVLAHLAGDYRLGVISDTWLSPGRVLREVLDRLGVFEYFAYLFFSDEHGVCKPHAGAFATTLEQLGVTAAEAAHVGDMQRTDIAGAQAAGMSAVHYLGANPRDAEISTADATVTAFSELPAALRALPRRRRWFKR